MTTTTGKARAIRTIFAEVPPTYDLVNHVLTLGLDTSWRRRMARLAARGGGERWVDMCTGTGETAIYLSRLAPEGTRVCGVDFSPRMMAEARRKTAARPVAFVLADVKSLPFPDVSLDLVTMSFATRNVNLDRETLVRSFREYHRVLKPGGRFVNIETSQPPCPVIRRGFHWTVGLFVKPIGAAISGSRRSYAYLARSIPRFYDADALADVLREAGFATVTFERLLLGAAAIHVARKAGP